MTIQKDHGIRELGRLTLTLRRNLVFTPQTAGREWYYAIEDPVNSKFHRVGLAEYNFISLLDGKTSVESALRLAAEASPEHALSEHEAAAICKWLVEHNLAHTAESSRARPLVAAARDAERAIKWQRINPIIIRLPLLHPDRFFGRVLPWIGWMHSRPAIVGGAVVTVVALLRLGMRWEQFVASSAGILAPSNWLWMLLCWMCLKLVHEIAHGVVCKQYGGSVREAGVLLILFAPLAYVDVTSSWRFRSKWQRIQTAAAGMYVEVFVAAIAAIIWTATEPGPLNHVCYNVVIMASFMTLVLNINPLMRFDGYYIFSDLMEIPNLYSNGQQYMQYWRRRYLLGIRSTAPSWSRSQYVLITVYGIAAFCWRLVVCAGLVIAASTLFHGAGIALAGVAVVLWLGTPAVRLVRYFARGQLGGKLKLPRLCAVCGSVAAAAVLICVLPWPGHIRAPAVVDYDRMTVVRASSPGFVREIQARSGQTVERGQILAVIENDELQFELRETKLAIEKSKVNWRVFKQNQDIASSQAEIENLTALQEKEREFQSQVDQLIVRAPRGGKVISRNLPTLLGVFLHKGDTLLSIGDEEEKELVVAVAQQDIDVFKNCINEKVDIRLRNTPLFEGRLDRLDPRATWQSPHPALCASMGGPLPVRKRDPTSDKTSDSSEDYELLAPRFAGHVRLGRIRSDLVAAGQTATVKVRSLHESIAGHLYRLVDHWIKDRFQQHVLASN